MDIEIGQYYGVSYVSGEWYIIQLVEFNPAPADRTVKGKIIMSNEGETVSSIVTFVRPPYTASTWDKMDYEDVIAVLMEN